MGILINHFSSRRILHEFVNGKKVLPWPFTHCAEKDYHATYQYEKRLHNHIGRKTLNSEQVNLAHNLH